MNQPTSYVAIQLYSYIAIQRVNYCDFLDSLEESIIDTVPSGEIDSGIGTTGGRSDTVQQRRTILCLGEIVMHGRIGYVK